MASQRHVCLRISDEKKSAYLSWVNALKNDGTTFSDFNSLRLSGFLTTIARRLYASSACDRTLSDRRVLETVLSDYYGAHFVNAAVIDAIANDDPIGQCPCEVEWQYAMTVALLLNRALNDPVDESYVNICVQFPASVQNEIYKTFQFLATETSERPPPSDVDWRSFLSSPIKECVDTPVTTRRPIKPQKLVANGSVQHEPSEPSPISAASNRRGSFDEVQAESPLVRSPILEGRGSPLVRSTAKLREKAVEVQKLKRELCEITHVRDLQTMELADALEKLRTSEMETESLRRKEQELRATVQDLQCREEKLAAKVAELNGMEKEVQWLTNELAAATVDKNLFGGLEKERNNLFAELGSVTDERDALERALAKTKSDLQRSTERLHGLTETHVSELQQLINKNGLLASENRKLHDLLDEAHCDREETVKLNKEIDSLKKHIANIIEEYGEERNSLTSKVQSLESQISQLQEEKAKNDAIMGKETASMTANVCCGGMLWHEKISQLQNQVSALTSERDSLLTALGNQKRHTLLMVPIKRARQDSSRSGTSAGTFGGSSVVSNDRHNTRFENCEDEDDVMLQNTMEPGGDHIIRDACIPAARGDNGITPGRKRLSTQSCNVTEEEFKVPALPKEPVVRSLQFQDHRLGEPEENWSDSASVLEKLEPQESGSPGTPWDKRLSVLNLRNKRQPPHLKSSYPVEIQGLPADVKDEELKNASAYEPPPSVQASVMSKIPPPTNVIRKKTVASGRSPAAKFLSKLAKREPKQAKTAAKDDDESLPRNTAKAVCFEIPNTPSNNKKSGIWPRAVKKKDAVVSSTMNSVLKGRKKV